MQMEGDLASNWEFFKDNWDNYIAATELDEKPQAAIVVTLLLIIGKECFKVFKNLPMTDDEQKKSPKKLEEKLTQEFEKERNIIYERYVYNSCVQGKESFDHFLAKLQELIATFKYGTLENEILCDHIVIGINNNDTKEQLLCEKDLTLDAAINIHLSEKTMKKLGCNYRRSAERKLLIMHQARASSKAANIAGVIT